MYLFIDTETTGLPNKRSSSVFDVENWPRIVEIAWLQFDIIEREIKRSSHIIKPEGFTIPRSATKIHGISTETAKEEGVPLLDVLNRLSSIIEQSTIIVFHNKAFDENVIGAEFIRAGIRSTLFDKPRICTMIVSTSFCKIPGPYGHKWPTLDELHYHLFKEVRCMAHSALQDTETCAKCFFELKRLKIIDQSMLSRRYDPVADWSNRTLCSDGQCTGTIGSNFRCRTCGKEFAPKIAKPSLLDTEWGKRKLCPDESCIGVQGENGYCSECGDDWRAALSKAEVAQPEVVHMNAEWGKRKLCPDESCIGVQGENGYCSECGDGWRAALSKTEVAQPEVVHMNAEWEKRKLCPYESCIGVQDENGYCSECGDDWRAALSKTEVAQPEVVHMDAEWEKRKLCSDGSCIGVQNENGYCSECGDSWRNGTSKTKASQTEVVHNRRWWHKLLSYFGP